MATLLSLPFAMQKEEEEEEEGNDNVAFFFFFYVTKQIKGTATAVPFYLPKKTREKGNGSFAIIAFFFDALPTPWRTRMWVQVEDNGRGRGPGTLLSS